MGGMGVVYKARHRELNRLVALKMLRYSAEYDPEYRDRFRSEAEAVARLQHPNIIQVFEVGMVPASPGELDKVPFIALEYVDGASLSKFTSAPQSPRFAAGMVETLARAAHTAHRVGVVHRDLKPANVLLTQAGEPKIADFGVAKQIHADRDASGRFVTQAGIAVGTPEYMAPEQVAGEEPTPAIDIHALGVILYELLTARVPFQGPTSTDTMCLVRQQEPVPPRRLQPDIPRDLETICLKCLSKSPSRRYESGEALADDLARWAQGRSIVARPIGPVSRTARWALRNPSTALLSAAVVVVALAGISGVIWKWNDAEKQAKDAWTNAQAERWERYRASIAAATDALQVHDIGSARRALDAAPEEHRNWEWFYLIQQLDTSQQVLVNGSSKVHWNLLSSNAASMLMVDDQHVASIWDLTQGKRLVEKPNGRHFGRSSMGPEGRFITYVPLEPDNNLVYLHNVAENRIQAVLKGHTQPVRATGFNRDGTRLLTCSRDGTVCLWDTTTAEKLLGLQAHETPVGFPAFSPDGQMFATPGTRDRTVRVWEAKTGNQVAVFEGHTWNVDAVAFSPDGQRLLAVCQFPSNTLWLWDFKTKKLIQKMSGHTNEINSFHFSPDGKRIITASMDQSIRLWSGLTGELINEITGHSGWANDAAFSPDGKYFISASHDRTVRIWDTAFGKPVAALHGHNGPVLKAAYAPDGKTICSGSSDGTIRVWDADRAERDNRLRGHESFVYGVAFHPDGRRVASASWDCTVRIWDATTGRELRTLRYEKKNKEDENYISSVAFHPQGEWLASVGRDNFVHLWDVDSGNEVYRFPARTANWQDTRVAFSPDGRLLATGDANWTVRIWDVKSKTEYATLKGHTDAIRDVAFSPDGRYLASAAEDLDRSVRIWDVEKKVVVQVLRGHNGGVYSLAFNRAGTLLATGSVDNSVRLWDTATWDQRDKLPHETNICSLAFTPDGSRLASACTDNTIRLWDMATRKHVGELRGHAAYVHSIAFSPDGTRLVSGSGDSMLRIWDTLPARNRKP